MSMENKRKVLVIQSAIPQYRVPVFNVLAESVDLTVVYDRGDVPADAVFRTRKVGVFNIKGKLFIHRRNLLRLAKKYDVVISMLDFSYVTTRLLCRFRRKAKLILWGIGVAASYNVRYDSIPEVAVNISEWLKKADAALFYSSYPVRKYADMGIPQEKLFVAENTVQVFQIAPRKKDLILFVGSLYKAKKIFELLNCYASACRENPSLPQLAVIGDGEDAAAVTAWVAEHRMQQKVILTGAVYDETVLSEYFSRAIVCISPDQAGLSVLKSFGYGVPFVTHKDAITGGERLNIIHGENGILLNNFEEMTAVIADCATCPGKYLQMGVNAKRFYDENRTVEQMAGGFLKAINFVLQKQNENAGSGNDQK